MAANGGRPVTEERDMKDQTYVDFGEFERAIVESGLGYREQAGFVKVSGARGRNVYVARTKRVGRVDVSGFESRTPGVVDLGEERFGNVTGQLDFSGTQEEVLASFRALLGELAAQPPHEGPRARRGSTMEPPTGQPVQGTQPAPVQGAQTGRPRTPTDEAMGRLAVARTRQRRPSMGTGPQSPQADAHSGPRQGQRRETGRGEAPEGTRSH